MKPRRRPHQLDATCPHCGKGNDTSQPVGRPVLPSVGDVSICIECGGLSIFTATVPRKPDAGELEALLADRRIVEAMSAIRAAHETGLL